jgi:hypothetical protein
MQALGIDETWPHPDYRIVKHNEFGGAILAAIALPSPAKLIFEWTAHTMQSFSEPVLRA